MAQLKHVLGSILRALHESRISSDASAGQASRAYQEDKELRHFSVPRVDVSCVEIDLKFAVSGLKSALQAVPETKSIRGDIERNQVIDGKFQKFSARITEAAIEAFVHTVPRAILEELSNEVVARERLKLHWQRLKKKISSGSFKKILIDKALQFFRKKQSDMVTDGFLFDYKKASDPLKKFFVDALCRQIDATPLREHVDISTIRSGIETAVFKNMKEMRDELRLLGSSSEALEVTVDVATGELKDVDKEKISSIKVKAALKNYVWRRIEHPDGKVERQLIPE